MAFNSIIGSRAEVWHGSAKKTSGGLTKSHLMKNKSGRIVSRKKHFSAKKDNRLVKAGFKTKKGHFGFIKTGSKKRGHGKKMRGGMAHSISNASDYDPSSIDVQMRAGRGGEPIQNGGSPYGNNLVPEELSAAPMVGPSASAPAPKQAGGRRRRHRHSHKMRGGTGSKMYHLSPSDVEARASMAP
jgi:hypothetical protein